ncbi:hypothetical protein HOG21_02455 [bacterium]|nr:hypothetical protein [bacterium]
MILTCLGKLLFNAASQNTSHSLRLFNSLVSSFFIVVYFSTFNSQVTTI